jgi:hypothetical protein
MELGPPIQAESSQAAARKLCWDRPCASAALRAAVAPLSPRPVAAVQAELMRVQQLPLPCRAASNRAAARRPCSDRRIESVQQAAVAAMPSSSPAERMAVRQAASALRLVQARVPVEVLEAAVQARPPLQERVHLAQQRRS